MVLAPFVFVAFAIVVEELISRGREIDLFGGDAKDARNPSACDRDLIKFAHAAVGNVERSDRILAGCGENDGIPVGGEGRGKVVAGVEREPGGLASLGGDFVNVVIAVAVGGKGNRRAVGRPNRAEVTRNVLGQRRCRAAGTRDGVEIAPTRESDGRAIRRDRRVAKPLRIIGLQETNRGEPEKELFHEPNRLEKRLDGKAQLLGGQVKGV